MLTIEWINQEWQLLPERALHWPAQRSVIVADVHFGKAAAFRARGVPVPEATTAHDLARLTRVIQLTGCRQLILLGDLLHARDGRAEPTLRAIRAWRDAHPILEITLVRGNHDHAAGDPPDDWRINCVDEPFEVAGIALRHAPDNDPRNKRTRTRRPTIAGHVHPCVRLSGADGSVMRVACFVLGERDALLPAFGSFTGKHALRPREGDRLFAVGPDEVREIATVVA